MIFSYMNSYAMFHEFIYEFRCTKVPDERFMYINIHLDARKLVLFFWISGWRPGVWTPWLAGAAGPVQDVQHQPCGISGISYLLNVNKR